MISDKKYIEIYNKTGNIYFGKGDDKQLKDWGNSEVHIEQMKIDCVKKWLNMNKSGIKLYKIANRLLGGTNIL